MNVVVVDLGIGNMQSLKSALAFLGVAHQLTDDPRLIGDATHVVLPGVGSFDAAMLAIDRLGFHAPLRRHALDDGKPLIGVCLGMQLLSGGSDEGTHPGLGFVPGRAERLRFDAASRRKVPHVGFASVEGHADEGLFRDIGTPAQFYFTHSFGLSDVGPEAHATYCDHTTRFVAGFQQRNICGVQFHPEKSQSTGLRLLSNFFELA